MFAHSESLLPWNIFHNIEAYFFFIGYTNEDIDQDFHETVEWFRSVNALTPLDFHFELQWPYHGVAWVIYGKCIANWSNIWRKDRVLNSVRKFLHDHQFSSTPLSIHGSRNDGILVWCREKVNGRDGWESFRSKQRMSMVFFKHLLDILNKTAKWWSPPESWTRRNTLNENKGWWMTEPKFWGLVELLDHMFQT